MREFGLILSDSFGTLSNSVDGPENSIFMVGFFLYTSIARLKCLSGRLVRVRSVAKRARTSLPRVKLRNFLLGMDQFDPNEEMT